MAGGGGILNPHLACGELIKPRDASFGCYKPVCFSFSGGLNVFLTHHLRQQKRLAISEPFLLAEAVGFEPTGDFTRHSISSRDRYDHFDTPPYAKC